MHLKTERLVLVPSRTKSKPWIALALTGCLLWDALTLAEAQAVVQAATTAGF